MSYKLPDELDLLTALKIKLYYELYSKIQTELTETEKRVLHYLSEDDDVQEYLMTQIENI
ncbi:MAG: hypothetical protein MUE91_07260 [Ignavibacteriaceae bacterium]|nr:hypothetical protein [Ignavibacteriaceae bacterium]